MTTEANAGGAAPATATNTGGAPNGESLLTEGTPGAADAKPASADGAAGDAKVGEEKVEDKGTQVPEKYDFKMPEGIELDSAAAEEFSALAKELKLDNATAQRVADIAAKMQQKQLERHAETVNGWAETSKVDKEFGGDNLQPNLAIAQKAIDTFGSSELKTFLSTSGLGNHPELIRFAFKAGKAISEDGFVKAGARTATPAASLEKRLYPSMN